MINRFRCLAALSRNPQAECSCASGHAHTGPTGRQHARQVSKWIASVNTNPLPIGSHALQRIMATQHCHRIGTASVPQPLLASDAEQLRELKARAARHTRLSAAVDVRIAGANGWVSVSTPHGYKVRADNTL
jgi:hypothetical protein